MRRATSIRLAAAAMALVAGAARPPAAAGRVADEPAARRLDLFLRRLVPFGYSGGILVAAGERILLDEGYGLADAARDTPNTPATVFPLDSVAKQFTAAAILKLEMTGRLSVTDPLARFFPDLPEDKRAITLHHLLTHTSGIVAGTEEYFPERSREGILAVAFARPLDFPPGTDFSYSNIGYAVLAAVVEKASGTEYERFLHDQLLVPAGMTQTGREIPFFRPGSLARRYAGGVDDGTLLEDPYPDWNYVGAGSFLSTTGDMFRWHQALTGDAVLSPAAKEKLYRPERNNYAYGWRVTEGRHGRLFEHNGGSSDGSACQLLRFVDRGITIMIFANRDGEAMLFGSGLMAHVETLAFGGEVPLPPEVAAEAPPLPGGAAGTYELAAGGDRFVLEPAPWGAALRAFGQAAIDALLPADEAELEIRRRATAATERVLRGLVLGESQPLAETIFDPARAEAYFRDLSEGLELDGSASWAVLGTVPDHRDLFDHMTFFELATAAGTRLARFHWAAGKIRGLGGSGIPEPVRFGVVAAPTGGFAGYNLAESTTVAFELSGDRLVLASGVQAKRRVDP